MKMGEQHGERYVFRVLKGPHREVSPEERTEWTGEVGGTHLEGLKGSGDLVLYLGACRKPQVRA